MPTVSDDGRWVAFASEANNLTEDDIAWKGDFFVRDMQSGALLRLGFSQDEDYDAHAAMISGSGRYVAAGFIQTLNNEFANQMRLFDLQAGTSTRLPAAPAAVFPSISGDGRYVAFLVSDYLQGTPPVSYVYDRLTRRTQRIPLSADHRTGLTRLSADGRFVALEVYVSHPPGWQFDIVRYEQASQRIEVVSQTPYYAPAQGSVFSPNLSADGRYVTFTSDAGNLVAADTNSTYDIFVVDLALRDPLTAVPRRNLYTTTTPTLTWNRVTGAQEYVLQVDDNRDFGSMVVNDAFDRATFAAQVGPLPDHTTYYWRIRTLHAGNRWSPWSVVE
ncbi:MAG: hypothetical protein K8I30_05320, partial [Anaerolineae bacterium]|nr:hypothetical protein [Anaerolineae bacterium]